MGLSLFGSQIKGCRGELLVFFGPVGYHLVGGVVISGVGTPTVDNSVSPM